MNYLTGKPDELEPTALRLYRDYGCSSDPDKFHYVRCYGRACPGCRTDPELYRVCPGCGSDLKTMAEVSRSYRCLCGTVLYMCMRRGDPIVTRYIANPLLNMEEDTI